MKTTQVTDLTNSIMQAMAKEFRKNDISIFGEHYDRVRPLIDGIVMSVVADELRKNPARRRKHGTVD